MTDGNSTPSIPSALSETEGQDTAPAVPADFAIRDTGSANWLIRKVMEARAYTRRVQTWAAQEIHRSESDERFLMHRYGSQLEAWARQQLAAGAHRRRSIALPAGTVGFRTTAAHLAIVDQIRLLHWCAMNLPHAIQIDVRANGTEAARLRGWLAEHCPSATIDTGVTKGAIDDHFRHSGECPDGTECVTQEKFFIR